MPKFLYGKDGKGKLVRTKTPEVIMAEGHEVVSRELAREELVDQLLSKILEEHGEIIQAMGEGDNNEILDEVADLTEVVNALGKALGFNNDEINAWRAKKSAKKGGFDEGIFIEYIVLNPDGDNYDFWLDHFRRNAHRYPEVKD